METPYCAMVTFNDITEGQTVFIRELNRNTQMTQEIVKTQVSSVIQDRNKTEDNADVEQHKDVMRIMSFERGPRLFYTTENGNTNRMECNQTSIYYTEKEALIKDLEEEKEQMKEKIEGYIEEFIKDL